MSDSSLFAWTTWRIQVLTAGDRADTSPRPLRPRTQPAARSAQAAAICREAA